MAWLQVKVATAGEYVETVENALGDQGAAAISLEDGGDTALLEPEPGATPLWDSVCVIGLFDAEADRDTIAETLARLRHGGVPLEIDFADVPDREWSRLWREDWEPLVFGERLWVAPLDAEVPADAAVILRLDPGLAFGTGTHATTALCLEWLARQDLRAQTVLDYGCGSGILAIAALRLGAYQATAVDIDPQALEASRDNAHLNGVGDRLHTVSTQALAAERYPCILANILAGPLTTLAADFAARQRCGDRLVLAGILADQAETVCAAYQPWYRIDVGAERDSWVRLEASRR